MKKKLLSILLAISMLLVMIPTTIFAENNVGIESVDIQNGYSMTYIRIIGDDGYYYSFGINTLTLERGKTYHLSDMESFNTFRGDAATSGFMEYFDANSATFNIAGSNYIVAMMETDDGTYNITSKTLTIADLVTKADGGFPTTAATGWKNNNNDLTMYYIESDGIYVSNDDDNCFAVKTDPITKINSKLYDDGCLRFALDDNGNLISVELHDYFNDYDGVYTPHISTTYPVYVNGKQVTDDNKNDVLGNGNGEIVFTPAEDPNEATLTILEDCEISGLECNAENLIITSGDKPVTLTTTGPIKLGNNDDNKTITIKGSSSTNTLTIKPKKTDDKNTFRPIAIRSGNTLNLLEGVILTGSNLVDNGGGMINVASNAVLNMNGAIIENCHVTTDDYDNASSIKGRGGAIYVAANGTFNMTGGEIKKCSATVAGGAIYSVGTVNMNGGKITECSVSGLKDPKDNKVKAKGGAIYILEPGTLTVKNAEISNNTIGDSNSNDMRGSGIYLSANALFSAEEGAVIQNNKHYDGTVDNIYLAGAVAEVEDIIAGNAIPYRSLTDALAAADTYDVVRLIADIDTSENININVGNQVILDLNNHTVNTTGTVTVENKGVINLYNENANIIDYLLYNAPGAYGAGEELKLPNDTNPKYIVPEGTFLTTEVGSSPNYQEFDVAVFDGTFEWNTDVKKGTQLNVIDDLALGGNIIAPTDDNDKETNVKTTNLKLNDDVVIGSNNEEDGSAVLTVESYDSIDGSHVKGSINANGHKIVLNKTGVLVISDDVVFDKNSIVVNEDGMAVEMIRDTENKTYRFVSRTAHHYTNDSFSVDEGYNKNLEFVTDAENWEENDVTVKVDGKVLDPSKYDLAHGSLHVILHGDYIKTLAAGRHTLTTMVTGYATINQDFYIKGKPSPSPYIVPNTGVR